MDAQILQEHGLLLAVQLGDLRLQLGAYRDHLGPLGLGPLLYPLVVVHVCLLYTSHAGDKRREHVQGNKGLDGTCLLYTSNLFDHVNIDPANTNVPNGLASDPEAECERYNQVIRSMGGIDIQVLSLIHI